MQKYIIAILIMCPSWCFCEKSTLEYIEYLTDLYWYYETSICDKDDKEFLWYIRGRKDAYFDCSQILRAKGESMYYDP